MLTKSQKLSLGIVLLLVVDVIWVASSELTKVSALRNRLRLDFIVLLFFFHFSSCIKLKTTTSHSSARSSRLRCSPFTWS